MTSFSSFSLFAFFQELLTNLEVRSLPFSIFHKGEGIGLVSVSLLKIPLLIGQHRIDLRLLYFRKHDETSLRWLTVSYNPNKTWRTQTAHFAGHAETDCSHACCAYMICVSYLFERSAHPLFCLQPFSLFAARPLRAIVSLPNDKKSQLK